jgi:large repetitive protein
MRTIQLYYFTTVSNSKKNINSLSLHIKNNWRIAICTVLIGFISIFGASSSNAATITVTANTNWSALTGGSGPGGLPNSSDIVQINSGATLTVNVTDAVCSSITIGGGTNNTNSILLFNSGSILTVGGGVNINGSGNRQGSITMTSGGTLKIGGSFTISNLSAFAAGAGTIEYNAAGTQTATTALGAYNNVTLSGSGAKTVTGITVNGTLSLQGTATATGTAPTYGASASLEYKGSSTQTTSAVEFVSPFNGTGGVVVNNASGVTLHAARTIAVGSKLTIGNLVSNSVFNDGGFQLTCTGTLILTSGTLNLGSAGTATTLPGFGTKTYSAGTTVAFVSGAAQTVAATSYPNLTFSGAGTKTTASGTATVSENWSTTGGTAALNTNNTNFTITGNISGSGNITSGSGTITLAGSWTNNGTFTANSGTVNYNGTSQTVAALTYNNLTVTQSSGSASLGGNATVNATFTLSAGNFILGSNNLVIGSSGSISVSSPSATKMIIASGAGELRKNYTATGSFVFPIGDNTSTAEYSPVTVNLTAGSGFSSSYIGVNVVNAKHPNNASATHFINRYWNITQSGITGATATVTGTYLPADINGTEASAKAAQLNGTYNQTTNPWVKFSVLGSNTLTATASTLTSGQGSAFTGITNANPSVNITGGGVTICSGNGVAITATPTGDATFIYTWSPGTGLSSTSVANPTASPTSTTAYTVTVRDGNGITATNSTTITVDQQPTVAAAGADQVNALTCGLTQVTLGGNSASVGTGGWSKISGTGGSFGNAAIFNTTFTGNAGGTYELEWAISNGVCTVSRDTMVVTFNINSTTPSSATASALTICPSANVDFNAVGGSLGTAASWKWYTGSCGGTLVGTGTPLSLNPTSTNTYYVRAEGFCGNTVCQSVTVTVDPGPASGIPGGITGNIITCNGATGVQYSVQPALNAASYNWTLPAGATQATGGNTRIITVDFPNPFTSGSICVVSRNACVIPSSSRCLNVTNIATFNPNRITGPTNVCLNTTGLTYTALGVNGATAYNWTLPTGMTITAGAGTQTITVDVGSSVTPGPMCVEVTNGCGTSLSYCRTINVNSTTTPGGITGASGVCANNTGLVYSVQNVSGASSYTWTVPTGFNIVSGQGTLTLTVDIGASPVAGDVCVTANFTCGSSAQRCLPVTINGATPGSISGPANFCAGATGVVFSVPALVDAISYNWTFPAGFTQTAGGTSNSVTVDVDPSFQQGDICVTVTSPCGTSAPRCKAVADFTAMQPGGISGPNVVCQNATGLVYSVSTVSGAVSYNWIVPPGITITGGLNTKTITVSIGSGFTVGDIGVRAVSSCSSQSQIRWNTKITAISPGIPGTISASADICPSTTIVFSIAAIAGASTYTWTLPSGMSFTAGPPTNTNSVSVDIGSGFKQGDICVTPFTSCGVAGNTKCQTYNIIPTVPGAITGPSGVCPSATGVSYSAGAIAGATSYTWELPPGWTITSGTGTNSILVSVASGFIQGQIRVYGVSSCGQKGRVRVLDVNYVPATPGVITGSAAICTGNTYVYSVPAVSGATSYTWSLPTGVTFTSGPPTNTNSVSVDVGGGFTGGSICVAASTSCGGPGAQRCLTVSTTAATPGAISGPAAVCQGATSMVYSITALPNISNYNWTVPANMTIVSGQGTTTLIVNIGGSFTSGQLCVAAQNACGASGATSCLNVSLTPDSPTSITPGTNFCPGATRTLTVNSVSGAASYTWVLPSGLTLLYGQGTSSITVSIDGGFVSGSVCVTALSSCSAAGTQFCTTISTAAPAAPASVISSSIVCAGSGVVFSVPSSTGPGSYTWSVPSGINIVSGQGSATIFANADPGFTSGSICVAANSGCSAASAQTCQTFSTTPVTPGNIVAPATVCANDPEVVFSITPLAGASSYNWLIPAAMTITSGGGSNAITVSVGAGFTSGSVSVTAVSACSVQGSPKTLTVGNAAPTPGAITSPVSVCPNATGLVFSIAALSTATSYTWTVPAEFTITAGTNTNSITVNVGAGFTTGQICVAAVSECGITGSTSCKTLTYLPPTPGGITGTTKAVCGQTLQYSVSNIVTATSYTWTPPAGASITSGQGTRIVNVAYTGAFVSGQLQVYASNACGNSGVRTSALITGAPEKPTVVTGLNAVCANAAGVAYSVPVVFNANSYTWTVPSGATVATGQGTNSVTVNWGTTAGNVSVTATNTCGTSLATNLAVVINCRISSTINPETNLNVYPNPAAYEFVVEYDAVNVSGYQFELVDLSGRVVNSRLQTSVKGLNKVVIDVRELPRGAYILKIISDDHNNGHARVILQ